MTTVYLEDLLGTLGEIERRARSVDVRQHADAPLDGVLRDVGDPTWDLINFGLSSFEEASCLLEEQLGDDSLAEESVTAASNIAFVAAGGILRYLKRLDDLLKAARQEQAEDDTALMLLTCCEDALDEIANAAAALEDQLRIVLDQDPRERDRGDETSLTLRLALARFWSMVDGDQMPTPANVRPRLQRAVTALAQLRGGDAFALLRFSDRHVLATLQTRLIAWFRVNGTEEQGMQLWLDMACFNSLLREVNGRRELVAHDREVIEMLLAKIDSSGLPSVSTTERMTAFTLLGLDAQLDVLLRDWRRGKAPYVETLATELKRVESGLGSGAGRQRGRDDDGDGGGRASGSLRLNLG